jgi:hypothetical protein
MLMPKQNVEPAGQQAGLVSPCQDTEQARRVHSQKFSAGVWAAVSSLGFAGAEHRAVGSLTGRPAHPAPLLDFLRLDARSKRRVQRGRDQ